MKPDDRLERSRVAGYRVQSLPRFAGLQGDKVECLLYTGLCCRFPGTGLPGNTGSFDG